MGCLAGELGGAVGGGEQCRPSALGPREEEGPHDEAVAPLDDPRQSAHDLGHHVAGVDGVAAHVPSLGDPASQLGHEHDLRELALPVGSGRRVRAAQLRVCRVDRSDLVELGGDHHHAGLPPAAAELLAALPEGREEPHGEEEGRQVVGAQVELLPVTGRAARRTHCEDTSVVHKDVQWPLRLLPAVAERPDRVERGEIKLHDFNKRSRGSANLGLSLDAFFQVRSTLRAPTGENNTTAAPGKLCSGLRADATGWASYNDGGPFLRSLSD
mmetsp:Transcript_36928/g.87742  ORF Transcript_36928/g.87742 Transcript_36928/m.87742 type:complete len:270 (-) Transcript_36928:151-960(-)